MKLPAEIQVNITFWTPARASWGSFRNSRKMATVSRKLRPTAVEAMIPTTFLGNFFPNRPLIKKPMRGNVGISQT